MATQYNPSLHEEPQNQPTKVIPLLQRESLLSWLESSGRFRSSEIEIDEFADRKILEDIDDILESENYAQEDEEEQLDSSE
jgi:Protein of unknown function (DUF3134)